MQRILLYQSREQQQVRRVNADTAHLQTELWSTVFRPAASQPTPLTALVASGMNDVLNSQGYGTPRGGTASRFRHGP
jgi:hypothetical protein